jgi:hypothetical protein
VSVAAATQTRTGQRVAPVPRLALTIDEACAALGVSWAFWKEHVAPEVKLVRRGRRQLVAVAELDRWLAKNGECILDDLAARR